MWEFRNCFIETVFKINNSLMLIDYVVPGNSDILKNISKINFGTLLHVERQQKNSGRQS